MLILIHGLHHKVKQTTYPNESFVYYSEWICDGTIHYFWGLVK